MSASALPTLTPNTTLSAPTSIPSASSASASSTASAASPAPSSSAKPFRVVPLSAAYRHRAAKCMSIGHARETLAHSGNFPESEMVEWAYEQVDYALQRESLGLSFVALMPSKPSASVSVSASSSTFSIESNSTANSDHTNNGCVSASSDPCDGDDVVGLCTSHDFGVYYPRLAEHVGFLEKVANPFLVRLSQGESSVILNERKADSSGQIDTSYEDVVITSFMLDLLNRFIHRKSLSSPPPLHSILYIDLLCVIPSASNLGIGSAIVSATLDAGTHRNFQTAISLLSSFYSQPLFFKRFEFECVEECKYRDYIFFNHRPKMLVDIKDTEACRLGIKQLKQQDEHTNQQHH